MAVGADHRRDCPGDAFVLGPAFKLEAHGSRPRGHPSMGTAIVKSVGEDEAEVGHIE